MEGWLKAVDATTGTLLWKFKCPSGIIGNPMTYLGPDGKQYVAVLSGVGGWAGAGVALGIGPEDPTAALGAIGAFGDYINISNAGHAARVRVVSSRSVSRIAVGRCVEHPVPERTRSGTGCSTWAPRSP